MTVERVDLSKGIFTVSGSNLAFDDKATAMEYLKRRHGLTNTGIFGLTVGPFESGADVFVAKFDQGEHKIICRRLVSMDKLDSVISAGW